MRHEGPAVLCRNAGSEGKVIRISGPVVGATGLDEVRLYDVVQVGEIGLVGEVIRLSSDQATIQVYEDTTGIRVGEPVINTWRPLVAQLGPGLLGSVYDGLQRPLPVLAGLTGDFIARGVQTTALPEDRYWQFTPRVSRNERVEPGEVLGVVRESRTIEHRIMVPPGQRGRVTQIRAGEFRLHDIVVVLETDDPSQDGHRKWSAR